MAVKRETTQNHRRGRIPLDNNEDENDEDMAKPLTKTEKWARIHYDEPEGDESMKDGKDDDDDDDTEATTRKAGILSKKRELLQAK